MKNIIYLSIALTFLTINAIKLTKKISDNDLDPDTRDEYIKHLAKYQRNFKDSAEFIMRAKIHKKNKDMIDKFNRDESQSAGWEMEVNHLADLTEDEVSKL